LDVRTALLEEEPEDRRLLEVARLGAGLVLARVREAAAGVAAKAAAASSSTNSAAERAHCRRGGEVEEKNRGDIVEEAGGVNI
jgi:hypothetical protein